MSIGYCDVCLGSDLEVYVGSSRCGRKLLRCRDCGLVAASGPAAASERIRRRRRGQRADARRAAVVTRLVPRGRVLEIGCDEGHFLKELDPSRYEAVGVISCDRTSSDPAPEPAGPRGNGPVIVSDLSQAALDAETFDVVVLFGALGYCSSPRALLMETSRLLRPGCPAVIEIPSLSSLTARVLKSHWGPLGDPGADFFFTQDCLQRLATTCGLLPASRSMSLLTAWPGPGHLLYIARKSAETVRAREGGDLARKIRGVHGARPLGATR